MNVLDREPAALLLEDGTVFRGQAYGARGDTAGEVVFNTSMTGYQEILTDPSYRAQIVTMTYPHIGNYGVNPADVESAAVQVAGFIVRDPCALPSNWRSTQPLEAYLAEAGVVGMCNLDTRALVRRIRVEGAMRGAILSGEAATDEALAARLAHEPPMEGRDLVGEVTCAAAYTWTQPVETLKGELRAQSLPARPANPYRVVAYDFGVKHNILRLLVSHGCEVTVVPATTPAAEVLAMDPDGIFLSNGPGDPAAVDYAIENVRALVGQRPMFGICLGHQIAALALGAQTYKLPFGHRGGNQPVKDLRTGKVEITSQNHGFAVAPEGLGPAVVSHVNLNDNTVAGLELRDQQLFSVQYHPEASPGPHDADYLFGRFTDLMAERRA
ncbi:MAG: glutamine-hydrolyzing carbamoyl-phosphate synthase small subunit [Myxococcales bacterium]|nr:glutamine-hydrolyzing carbamoyl-phosphate synthase small subunit [Myxococcales bacterium]MCB9524344.1 glutamine-hydrolyzing carbamoyl-phosphate synthase small subunit [Myxococcales bacterium]